MRTCVRDGIEWEKREGKASQMCLSVLRKRKERMENIPNVPVCAKEEKKEVREVTGWIL